MGVPCQPRFPARQQGPARSERARLGPRRCFPRTPCCCPSGMRPRTARRRPPCFLGTVTAPLPALSFWHPEALQAGLALLPRHPGPGRPAQKHGFLLAGTESEAMTGSHCARAWASLLWASRWQRWSCRCCFGNRVTRLPQLLPACALALPAPARKAPASHGIGPRVPSLRLMVLTY